MKLQLLSLCCVAVIKLTFHQVFGAKILGLLLVVTHSHHLWNRELMTALAKRGHEVTVISPDADPEPVANLTYIQTEGTYEVIMDDPGYENFSDVSIMYMMGLLNDWSSSICGYQLSTEGTKKLLSYPDGKVFDLIIAETEYSQCFWPFITKFGNPPVIGVSAAGIPRRANYMTGTPKHPAYAPDYIVPYTGRLNFFQRMESLIAEVSGIWHWNSKYLPEMQDLANRHFNFPVPDLEEYERNFSLLLTNTVFGYDSPRPITPNVIPVGGIHLKPPRQLEQNLQKFLDGAKDGAIYFSLGSNVKSALLPAHVIQEFLEAFRELPQRVLWKFELETKLHIPANVMLGKWLPQRDILGHKNIKLFITHNGLLGSQEALYFGVPTLGIPFFMDQHKNMERACTLGIGIGLPYKKLSKQAILRSIKQVLTNKRYTENAQQLSAVFRDQIDHPLDRAVFWTEYVLRHNGAPHLKSAAVGMPLYRYLLLDVLAVLLVMLTVALLVLRAVVHWLWSRLALLKQSPTKTKTQ